MNCLGDEGISTSFLKIDNVTHFNLWRNRNDYYCEYRHIMI